MSGYIGFNSSVVEEQNGNFIALKFDAKPKGAETTVEIIGGKKGPVKLDVDMTFVGRITDTSKQKIKVVVNGSETVTKTFELTELKLTAKPIESSVVKQKPESKTE